MISKRKMRRLRGRQRQVNQLNKFNYDFSTSPDYTCVVTNYYDKDSNFTH